MRKPMLLVACSDRKKKSIIKPTIATDVYDGVFYRVIKNAFRNNEGLADKISVYILSAKYGVIPSYQLILPYDMKMTEEISTYYKKQYTKSIKKYISDEKSSELIVVMGKLYRKSVIWDDVDIKKHFISGKIGIMQSELKKWLMSK